jgi:DNA-binding NarL/FixJ family response regulator
MKHRKQKMIKVLIVEPQGVFRDCLAALIEKQEGMRLAASTGDAGEAVEACREGQPDAVLMDVLADTAAECFAAAALIRKEFPEIKIVIMTGTPGIAFARAARRAGAHSFVYTTIGSAEFCAVIRNTVAGYSNYPAESSTALPLDGKFSGREKDVIRLICEGKSRREMAESLGLSEATVKGAIGTILKKTGLKSVRQVAVWAGKGI